MKALYLRQAMAYFGIVMAFCADHYPISGWFLTTHLAGLVFSSPWRVI